MSTILVFVQKWYVDILATSSLMVIPTAVTEHQRDR